MDFEITFENGSWPLICVCSTPADALCCIMDTARRMTSIDLDDNRIEQLMAQLPRLKTDMPIVKGWGFDVVRLDEPQEFEAPPVAAAPVPAPVPAPAPEPEPVPAPVPAPAPAPEPAAEDAEGYRGFLHLRCPKCGELSTFCSKAGVRESRCCKCGHIYSLSGLTRAQLACPCGNSSHYHTNRTDWYIDIPCIRCGDPVTLEYSPKQGCYRTAKGGRRKR